MVVRSLSGKRECWTTLSLGRLSTPGFLGEYCRLLNSIGGWLFLYYIFFHLCSQVTVVQFKLRQNIVYIDFNEALTHQKPFFFLVDKLIIGSGQSGGLETGSVAGLKGL